MKARRRRKRIRGPVPDLERAINPYREQAQVLRRQLQAAPAAILAQTVHPLVSELLQVLDDLNRAVTSDADGVGLHEGVVLIQQTMEAVLARHGVVKMVAAYQPFDPKQHHAVQKAIRPDLLPGYVLEVVQDGFLMNGEVLRPAMVVVTATG